MRRNKGLCSLRARRLLHSYASRLLRRPNHPYQTSQQPAFPCHRSLRWRDIGTHRQSPSNEGPRGAQLPLTTADLGPILSGTPPRLPASLDPGFALPTRSSWFLSASVLSLPASPASAPRPFPPRPPLNSRQPLHMRDIMACPPQIRCTEFQFPSEHSLRSSAAT